MRSIVAVAAGLGLLSLTACSETPPPGQPQTRELPVVENVPVASPAESHTVAEPGHDSHGQHDGAHGHSKPAGDKSTRIAVGDKVPEFEVTIDGKKFKLSELQKNTALTENGTLVLTFWCSFCHSCRDVEKGLEKLARQYHGKVGVIALDASAGETAEAVAKFAAKHGLTVPIALNASGTTADIFGARVTTTTIVIDSEGVLRYCGQFGDSRHNYAADALKAVLAGEEVRVKKTRHKG
jgi:thiol-disulfide isomerase/thioredoxin